MAAAEPGTGGDGGVVARVAHHPARAARRAGRSTAAVALDLARRAPGPDRGRLDPRPQAREPGRGSCRSRSTRRSRVDVRQPDPHHPRAGRAEHERRAAGAGRPRVEHAVRDA